MKIEEIKKEYERIRISIKPKDLRVTDKYISLLHENIKKLKNCGNCRYVSKHHYGGLFCSYSQLDTSHNALCTGWELNE